MTFFNGQIVWLTRDLHLTGWDSKTRSHIHDKSKRRDKVKFLEYQPVSHHSKKKEPRAKVEIETLVGRLSRGVPVSWISTVLEGE